MAVTSPTVNMAMTASCVVVKGLTSSKSWRVWAMSGLAPFEWRLLSPDDATTARSVKDQPRNHLKSACAVDYGSGATESKRNEQLACSRKTNRVSPQETVDEELGYVQCHHHTPPTPDTDTGGSTCIRHREQD